MNASAPQQLPGCTLCSNGASPLYPDREIAGFITPTCGVLAATLPLFVANSTSEECIASRLFAIYCGCEAEDTAIETCSLCSNKDPAPFPDDMLSITPFTHLLTTSADNFGPYTPTCAVWEGITANFAAGTPECTQAQGVGVADCGCPAMIDERLEVCSMCDDAATNYSIPETFRDQAYPLVPALTCGYVDTSSAAYSSKSLECYGLQTFAHHCGCRDGFYPYGNTENRFQQVVMAWAPRPAAILSVIGSLSIMSIAGQSGRRHTLYHQFMIGISFFDILSSIANTLSTWTTHEFLLGTDIPSQVQGAIGGYWSCKIQGVLSLLGGVSFGLNLSLSIYYYKVIVSGWKEFHFTLMVRALLLGPPILVGVILTGIAFPSISSTASVCSIIPVPWEEKWKQFIAISVIPTLVCSIGTPTLTILVCYKFVQQMDASQRWRMSDVTARASSSTARPQQRWKDYLLGDTMKGRVVRQSVFYLLALYAIWPVTITWSILASQSIVNYPLSLVVLMTTPLQGFNNAIVFFRPRFLEWWDARKKRAARVQAMKEKAEKEKYGKSNQTAPVKKEPIVQVEEDDPGQDSGNDNDDSEEEERFLRSHFFYSSTESETSQRQVKPEPDDDETTQRSPSTAEEGRTGRRDSVRVGSFVLPAHRGSALWRAMYMSEEVLDEYSDEDIAEKTGEEESREISNEL